MAIEKFSYNEIVQSEKTNKKINRYKHTVRRVLFSLRKRGHQ